MKKMNRSVRTLFGFALGLSIGFPVGVLCIVFGAVKWIVSLLVVGIILAIAGFYVMPILWVKYGEKRRYRTILRMIVEENIYTVESLSNQTNYSKEQIRHMINYLILANYLVGYLFHDDVLELNTNKKQSAKTPHTKKCKNCGGKMSSDGIKFICDYCGYTSNKD